MSNQSGHIIPGEVPAAASAEVSSTSCPGKCFCPGYSSALPFQTRIAHFQCHTAPCSSCDRPSHLTLCSPLWIVTEEDLLCRRGTSCCVASAHSLLENSTLKTVTTSEASIACDCRQSGECGGSFRILVEKCWQTACRLERWSVHYASAC